MIVFYWIVGLVPDEYGIMILLQWDIMMIPYGFIIIVDSCFGDTHYKLIMGS